LHGKPPKYKASGTLDSGVQMRPPQGGALYLGGLYIGGHCVFLQLNFLRALHVTCAIGAFVDVFMAICMFYQHLHHHKTNLTVYITVLKVVFMTSIIVFSPPGREGGFLLWSAGLQDKCGQGMMIHSVSPFLSLWLRWFLLWACLPVLYR
jgi:hypothetical protein